MRTRLRKIPEVLGGVDVALYVAVLSLIVLGVVMVYSASSIRAVKLHGDGHYFLVRQGVYAALGVGLVLGLARLDYHHLRALTKPVLFFSLALMVAVVAGLGRSAGGASRWISLGPINVQPSEIAKVALVLWLCDSLAKKTSFIRTFAVGFLPHVLVAGVLVLLCLAQPDFGSAAMFALLTFVLLFTAGAKIGYIVAAGAVTLPLAYLLLRLEDYRWRRIIAFVDPLRYRQEGGYQIVESWMSFGGGGAFGVGLGNSRQKMLFLPEAHTDFIAAIVAEELGFAGFVGLVLLFVVVVGCGMRGALRAVDEYGTYLGFGLSMFIGLAAATNLAVVLGLLPTKGLTLPFMSFGGSSLLVNCVAAGILLNVSRPRRPVQAEASLASGPAPEREPRKAPVLVRNGPVMAEGRGE